MTSEVLFERVFHETADTQFKVVVSVFRDVEYLHIRKYFLSFDEEWCPTKDGVSIPLELHSSVALFEALADLLSNAEVQDVLDNVRKAKELSRESED